MTDATLAAAPPSPSRSDAAVRPVTITDLDVPFGRLVLFFIKAGLAAIPAIVVVMLTIGVVGALLRGLVRFGYWGLHGGYGWW
jgi:hypothetical protein